MGIRLAAFDYSSPCFYMVTLKRRAGFAALSEIAAPGVCRPNGVTRALAGAVRSFHEAWRCVEPVECFSIMPDHIHLLLKIRAVEGRVTLPKLVWQLMRRLEQAYFAAVEPSADGAAESKTLITSLAASRAAGSHSPAGARVFERDWHDWIVKKDGQLAAFTRYIRENPRRHFLRASHREHFRRVGEVEFLGRRWFGYGNAALLDLPVIEPLRCSRKWAEGGAEWRDAVARAERIGSGGAGIGTFMSPCEKACGNAIAAAGGRWIVLSPEGFGPRWHPGRRLEPFCAGGRMLFLSLWPEMARRPTKAELHARCHEMGDIVVAGLSQAGNCAAGRDGV